jgi:transcriptional regulator with XRE-family HTH domain
MDDAERRKEVGTRLMLLRKKKELTQTELAAKAGITQQLISHYESGRNSMGIMNIIRISRVLNCQPQEIDDRYALDYDVSESERKRTRHIDNDFLLYLVDHWKKLSVEVQLNVSATVWNALKNDEAQKHGEIKPAKQKTPE